jgi:hypothetical protein
MLIIYVRIYRYRRLRPAFLGHGEVIAYVIYAEIQRGREWPVDRERKPISDYNLLIDGKMIPGDLTMPALNPATEEVLAQCPRASRDQLDEAVICEILK